MIQQKSNTLDIYRNLEGLDEPLCALSRLVGFFSENFNEGLAHDDSKQTRKRLQLTRNTLLKNLDELSNVLYAIDPDLVFRWQIYDHDEEDIDLE